MLGLIIPAMEFQHPFAKGLAIAGQKFAVLLSLILLIPGLISLYNSYRKEKLLDRQKDIDSIKALTWKEFEELIAEAYRRMGYSVVENYDIGPDGGVDIVLRKNGNTYLVQCKQWRSFKVGVKVVREMYGIMTDRRATGVMIITTGVFTQEAKNFAKDKPIDLIEGNQVVEMIRSVQAKQVYLKTETWPSYYINTDNINTEEPKPKISENICPKCGGKLVIRVARHGKNVGNKFWGCSNYPKCKFIKQYTD